MRAVALDLISLERIGCTFNEVTEDLLDAPLLQPIASCVPEINILCTVMAALTHWDSYRVIERNGELFIERRSFSIAPSPVEIRETRPRGRVGKAPACAKARLV